MGFCEMTGLAKWSDVLRCVFASMPEVPTMIDLDEARRIHRPAKLTGG